MSKKKSRPTWFGNSAKARIIGLIAKEKRPVTVFDYGAGSGGQWPDILPLLPNVSLVCFEPFAPSRVEMERRLAGMNARVLASPEGIEADIIVSFSVLEHVYDRAAYMRAARTALKPGGTFYLSYDDGHFRNAIDLAKPRFGPLREHLGNLAAPILPKIGLISRYQTRVDRNDADALVREAGFTVASERYENMASLKNLSKAVPNELMPDFMDRWIAIEDDLNAGFSVKGEKAMGDDNILWRVMGTRTLELK